MARPPLSRRTINNVISLDGGGVHKQLWCARHRACVCTSHDTRIRTVARRKTRPEGAEDAGVRCPSTCTLAGPQWLPLVTSPLWPINGGERERASACCNSCDASVLRRRGSGAAAAGHAWNAIRGSDTAPFSASSSVGGGRGVWIFRPACQSSAVKPDSTRHDAALRNAPL